MKYSTFLLFLILSGCSAFRNQPPSTFTVDGKKLNMRIKERSVIASRKANVDCLTRSNFDLHLNYQTRDIIEGRLLDARNKENIPFVPVLVYRDGYNAPDEYITDRYGDFEFTIHPTPIKIVVQYTGFDTLEISLERYDW